MFEVLAMIKQLRLPTLLMNLSCADLILDELTSTIGLLRKENLQDEDIQNTDLFTRCNYLNLNPVLLARPFQYRIKAFFQFIALDASLGKGQYHAIRIEFQVCGSPQVH